MREFAFLLFLKNNFFKRLKIQGFLSANTHKKTSNQKYKQKYQKRLHACCFQFAEK